jgi:hypothetical protein
LRFLLRTKHGGVAEHKHQQGQRSAQHQDGEVASIALAGLLHLCRQRHYRRQLRPDPRLGWRFVGGVRRRFNGRRRRDLNGGRYKAMLSGRVCCFDRGRRLGWAHVWRERLVSRTEQWRGLLHRLGKPLSAGVLAFVMRREYAGIRAGQPGG